MLNNLETATIRSVATELLRLIGDRVDLDHVTDWQLTEEVNNRGGEVVWAEDET